MRVCHVNLAKGYRGGERQTELLIRELATRAEQVLLVRPNSPLVGKLSDCQNVVIQELSRPYWYSAKKYFDSVDIVHAHEAKAVKLAATSKCPFIVSRRILKTPKRNWFTRFSYKRAELIVCISSAIENVMILWDGGLDCRVVGDAHADMAADVATVEALRSKWPEQYIIGHIGALVDADKGQADLIKALQILRQKKIDARLVLVGQGPDRQWLKGLAKGLPVSFAGYVEDVADYLATFDVFAFPSRQEGMGSSILDAMHLCVPVVAAEVGGIPDIVNHQRNGILVPSGSPESLASTLAQVLVSPEMSLSLTAGARVTADKYSASNMAANYFNVYQSVLQKVA